ELPRQRRWRMHEQRTARQAHDGHSGRERHPEPGRPETDGGAVDDPDICADRLQGVERGIGDTAVAKHAMLPAAAQSSAHMRSRLASDFEIRSNSALLPSRLKSWRRAVSRSNSNSRCAASRMKERAQPTMT